MKKIGAILLTGLVLMSGLGAAVSFSKQPSNIVENVVFQNMVISETETNTIVSLDVSNSWVKNPGKPLLPMVQKTYIFPFGTQINSVDVIFVNPQIIQFSKEIIPAPLAQTVVHGKLISQQQDQTTNTALYPETPFSYSVYAGIKGTTHVLFLVVYLYPIRCDIQDKILFFSDEAALRISYTLPVQPVFTSDDYDLVIIAPEVFSEALQPLVEHKNSHGVSAFLKTVESIYAEYTGVDEPEQIKYFIKDAVETMGVDYVLLVGGQKGQRRSWYVPVRYANLDDNSDFETSYVSDLYYADIYDAGGNFSSWDPNGNGIFAEWKDGTKEILDLVPDVYLGRIPCRSVYFVKIMVDKIITYETNAAGKSWFNDMVVVGGDSAPGDLYYEGEEENKKALEYMDFFNGVSCWTSDETLTGPQSVIDAVSQGCGFLFFDGHGNPSVWSTHPPNNESVWITGLSNRDMRKLRNGDKLPVCVVGGCHNAQFNTSLMRILEGIKSEGFNFFKRSFYYKDWVPECWAWKMVQVKRGGAIAVMGYTGLDWFATGDYTSDGIPDCTQFFSGYANTHFFKNYGVNDITVLGQTHTQTLVDYIIDNPPMSEPLDCKTVQEFVLLGDPSLQIGGYV
ncbi:MAG: C25 family cysteine peptidase [Candidatus Thermoplasmatota archaeon]